LINKHLKKIHDKSENDRIKIMWVAVVFCMIIILGGWFIIYKSNKNENRIANEISQMPSFPELQKNIDDINQQKEDFFGEITDMVEKAKMEEIAINYVRENKLMNEENILNLKLKNIEKLENNWHLEYQQYYQDILVNDNNISFLIDDAEKKVISHSSNFDSDINLSSVEPKITKEEAYKIAKEDLNKSLNNDSANNFDLKSSELVIYKNENSTEYYLAWKLNIFSLSQVLGIRDYYYFIDAENGDVISYFKKINN